MLHRARCAWLALPFALLFVLLTAGACGSRAEPRPLVAGEDHCDFCRMTITDPHHGGTLRTATGRWLTFDAVECLVGYVAANPAESKQDVWVADFESGTMVEATRALFILGGTVHSPMGRQLTSFAPTTSAGALQARYGGELLTWEQVLARGLAVPERAPADARAPTVDTVAPDGTHGAHTAHTARAAVDSGATVVTAASGTPLSDAIARAAPGARISVRAGVYREPTIRIDRPLTLIGEAGAILDGAGTHSIVLVAADDVTVRGFTLRNTGPGQSDDRAGIAAQDVAGCTIADNRFEATFFAIHLAQVRDCVVRGNVMRGPARIQTESGNGVHVWSSERVQVVGNDIRGHRDGIYFEFVTHSRVIGNQTEQSARYGMHFMFSDDCLYRDNIFRNNGNGVAVMYSHRVAMLGNRFEHNWGGAAYGLLLKDINDSRIERNLFRANSVGLYLEGANRNQVVGNTFRENGWALKSLANAEGNRYEGNVFESNTFDVGTNSRSNVSEFRGNYWDRYRGFDLDRDGVGDVPFSPVRLFALVVEQSPPTIILLHSLLVDLLDLAERVIPALTPETLQDDHPLMQRPRPLATDG